MDSLYDDVAGDVCEDGEGGAGPSDDAVSSALQLLRLKVTHGLVSAAAIVFQRGIVAKAARLRLDLQLTASQERVRILERNISCLFATARLEITRKDQQISRLQEL